MKTITSMYVCLSRSLIITITFSLLVMAGVRSFGQCTLAVSISNPSQGSLHANVTGGTAPYTYQWVNSSGDIPGATNPDITGLPPCQYLVKVRDAVSCSNIATYAIMPTNVSGTLTGSINGVAINCNVSGRLNPASGLGVVEFSPVSPSIGYSLQPNLCLGVLNAFSVAIEHGGALNGGHLFKGNFKIDTNFDYPSGETNHAMYVADYACGNTIVVAGSVSGTVPTLTNCAVSVLNWDDILTSPSNMGGEDIFWSETTLTAVVTPFDGSASFSVRPRHRKCGYGAGFVNIGGNTVTNRIFYPGLPFAQRRSGTSAFATYDAATMTLRFEVVNNVFPASNAIPTLSQWGLIILGLLMLCTGTVFILRRRPSAPMAAS